MATGEEICTDLFGQVINPGDFILRPLALGRSCTIAVSKVIRANSKGLRVANVSKRWDWRSSDFTIEPANPGTIKYAKRCVKIAPETVPHDIRDILDGKIKQ